MDPIRGETYEEYVSRVNAAGDVPLLYSELVDRGWEELSNGELWRAEIAGEEPPPSAETGAPPAPETQETTERRESITPLTIYVWVWCLYPNGEYKGPWTQQVDAFWEWGLSVILQAVDDVARRFCEANVGDSPPVGAVDYDWAIQSPMGLQYSRGI